MFRRNCTILCSPNICKSICTRLLHFNKTRIHFNYFCNLSMSTSKFKVEYAKSGRSSCKKCSKQIAVKALRLGSVFKDPRGFESVKWHHLDCFPFASDHFDSVESIGGFSSLQVTCYLLGFMVFGLLCSLYYIIKHSLKWMTVKEKENKLRVCFSMRVYNFWQCCWTLFQERERFKEMWSFICQYTEI